MIGLIDILATGVRDVSDNPLSLGSVLVYEAGTTTLTQTYQERDLENPHPNPIILDTGGRAFVWTENRVKLVIASSDGAHVRTIDNVGLSDADISAAQAGNLAGNGLDTSIDDKLAVQVDGDTITIQDNQLQLQEEGVNRTHLAPVGEVVSESSGNFSSTSTSAADVTNLSVQIETTGRPVLIGLKPDGSSFAEFGILNNGGSSVSYLHLLRDDVVIASIAINKLHLAAADIADLMTPPGVLFMDTELAAGTYTYKLQIQNAFSSQTIYVKKLKLYAFEL